MAETFTAHRYATDQQVFPVPAVAREVPLALVQPRMAAPAPDSPPVAAASDGSLAHRAVETILNIVDAQHNHAAETGVVNLHFKFAGEDLAVRVQLRGGEVHTQFRTDSAELRAALAGEWQSVVGPGSVNGVRLTEPVFSGSGTSGQNSSGSSPHGRFSSEQQAQQQTQNPSVLPELRALRRGAARPASVVSVLDSAPPAAATRPTSQHLAAFA